MTESKFGDEIVCVLKGLVQRSKVEIRSSYQEYKEELRYDFFWSCCYCTMTEIEAGSIKFHIDHYVPRSFDASLINDYGNLFWSCELCNISKGDIYPPEKARADGYRFLRADKDVYTQHIECEGVRLKGLTPTGEFTIEYAELNRKHLRDMRQLRKLAFECDQYVREGIRGLTSFPLDELPPHFRALALRSIYAMSASAEDLGNAVDEILMMLARSHKIDPDPEQVQRSAHRAGEFKQLRGLYPGDWRGRELKKSVPNNINDDADKDAE